ncbi:hypothetical protein [Nocardia cyriacigeorgica]|uniref:hypothetical protein n=1 Tax=Nocardia cyriacigeorgica TaxID=135487 RepID=UPI002456C778|nr:hypothetical protein [Nocardia cyriacigeorgica]
MDSVSTTTVRLLGRDRYQFRKNVVEWQAQLDDLSLSESEALNAAVILINKSSDPEAWAEELRTSGTDEETIKRTINAVNWFNGAFIAIMRKVVDERNSSDKRKGRKKTTQKQNSE